MTHNMTVKSPACHTGHLVSCTTTGLAKELSPTHSASSARSGLEIECPSADQREPADRAGRPG
jgi:hypothetical protein